MTFAKFLIKRAVHGLVVAWAALTIIFLLRFLSPFDVVTALIPPEVAPSAREGLIKDLGLDQPMHIQYLNYLAGVLRGDLGFSYHSRIDVVDLMIDRLPATVELAATATLVSVVLSIPLGVISAIRRHKFADHSASLFALLGISTPNFWLGIMLVLLLSVHFNFFPTSGRPIGFVPAVVMLLTEFRPSGLLMWMHYMTLPAVTLGTYYVALLTRLTRGEMLEQLGQGYVRVLRAKGLPETLVTLNHVLRNSLLPIVTVVGLQFGSLLNGAVVVEVVFRWPGLGEMVIRAINALDWPVIQGVLIVVAIAWVIINTVVDIVYSQVDPRITLEGGSR
jgi:peptide/nickel transport system permease protein